MARAFVCGCAGTILDDAERAFFRSSQPWGLILFKRNVESPDQLARLVSAFRDCVGRPDAPVLVDQEGGRVQRLGPPLWPRYPSCSRYAGGADPAEAARLGGRLIALDLERAGITVDCAPVLDVPAADSSTVVGDRAFAREPGAVARLGRAFAEGLLAGGVLPVIKHMPGHGRAVVDSHFDLPVVDASRAELAADLAPFRALADLPIAMTAHVVYTSLDADRPATISPFVIDVTIRGEIGFDGLLLSDDLSMRALRGSLGDRAAAALSAGCDIALHCNGVLEEARAVAEAAPWLRGAAERRADTALSRRRPPEPFDVAMARARLDALAA